jgi:DNA gyrase subunit A
VKLIKLNNNDEITSVTRILKDPDEKEAEELDEEGNVVVKPVAVVEGEADEDILADEELDEEDDDVAEDDEEDENDPSEDSEA